MLSEWIKRFILKQYKFSKLSQTFFLKKKEHIDKHESRPQTPLPPNPIRNVFYESSARTQNGLVCVHHCFPSVQIKCDIHWVQTLVISNVRLHN